MLIDAFKATGLIHELTQSSTVDDDKLTEVKTLLDDVVVQLKESSVKIPVVPDEVRKQFKEMILADKDSASASDAKSATSSDNDTSHPSVHKPVHPFDVLRKASIQFESYVMFVQAWLTSATHTFSEVVESYNSSLKSYANILDYKRQRLEDASILLNHHLQSL